MDVQELSPGAEQVRSGFALDAPAPRYRWRLRPRFTVRGGVFLLISLVTAYLTLVPLGTLVVASFQSNFLGTGPNSWTVQNYVNTLTDSGFLSSLGNSLEFSALSTIFAIAFGMLLAWLYVRTNIPGKSATLLISVVPLIIPGLINTAAWVLLLSPRTGFVNTILADLHLPQVQVFSMQSMVFVQTLHMVPIAFLMGLSTMGSMDRSLEEAAATSGAGPSRVIRSITLPLLRSGVLGAALLIFVLTMASFEVPQLIGVPAHKWVLTTQIFNATSQFPVQYGTVSVLGMVVLVVTLLGVLLSRKFSGTSGQTVTGKGYRPSIVDLRGWRWAGFAFVLVFGIIGVVLPVLALIWTSFLPVYRNPSIEAFHKLTLDNYRSIFKAAELMPIVRNTFEIALAAALIATAICLVVAYVLVKTKVRGRRILEMLATAPIALPSVIIGVALLYWYLVAPLPIKLYGSKTIIVVAFVTTALPFSLRFLVPALSQISDELEEAAANSGANMLQVFRRIYLPLLSSALTASFLFCFIVSFREFTSALFLYTQRSEVLSVYIYSLWVYGSYTAVCALGVLMIAVLAVAVVVVRMLGSRGAGRRARARTLAPVPVETLPSNDEVEASTVLQAGGVR